MNNIEWSRLQTPITTGSAQLQSPAAWQATAEAPPASFSDVLKRQLEGTELAFSKHATQRAEQRGIELTDASIDRLSQGVQLARDKGINDALVIVDQTAFIVNARLGRVITTVGQNELQGNVFTNIEGTVII